MNGCTLDTEGEKERVIKCLEATIHRRVSEGLSLELGAVLAQLVIIYLLSRDYYNLRAEFQAAQGKIKADCSENVPSVEAVKGQHIFLTVRDHLLSKQAD
ncbi:hypothetical protein Droror1_Dr00027411 [Drosera rotundifolia]